MAADAAAAKKAVEEVATAAKEAVEEVATAAKKAVEEVATAAVEALTQQHEGSAVRVSPTRGNCQASSTASEACRRRLHLQDCTTPPVSHTTR